MKKLVSRTKKHDRATHSKRTRAAVAILGVVLAVTGAVAASMLAAPGASALAPSSPAPAVSKSSTASNLSPQRAAENRRAQAELASPNADYAEGTTGTTTKAPPVTLTGCLEQKGDEFRLKDASGADAPRSRSWKTGFLTKHTSTIDVVDTSHKLKLNDHIGQRVSVTGTLLDREMHAKTLKGAGSCD